MSDDILQRAKDALAHIEPGHWSGVPPKLVQELIAEVERLRAESIVQNAVHERELAAERAHGDRWQKLAGAYDEIRYALRNASDDQAGHAQFYNEAAELIFPEAQP